MASPAPGRMIVLTGVCSDCVMPQVRPRFLFFFNDPATTEIYTLSLHDALPILVLASLPPRTAPERVALARAMKPHGAATDADRKSTRLNSSHGYISYAVFCLKKKKRPSGSQWQRTFRNRHKPRSVTASANTP